MPLTCFEGVNNSRFSMIASQYFLLSKQLSILCIYDCQIGGETFSPIGFLWYKYEALPKYGKIPQYFCEFSDNLREWNASFKFNMESTSHLELPSATNVFFINGYAKSSWQFQYSNAWSLSLLSCVTFLLINITGLE